MNVCLLQRPINAAKEIASLYFTSSTNIKIYYYLCTVCHFVKNCFTRDGGKEDKCMKRLTDGGKR